MTGESYHYVRRKPAEAKRSLLNAVRSGGVTLVLGAGVSVSRGAPTWTTLVRSLWAGLTPTHEAPPWLGGAGSAPHPLALQIMMEEIEGAICFELANAKGLKTDDVDPADVRRVLVKRISDLLYARDLPHDPNDTLGAIVDLLRREQRSDERRVRQVITFNADDLLERGANRDVDAGKHPILFPVPRGSFHPRYDPTAFGKPPITVYHLHGFVPRSSSYLRGAPDTLIFTDAQYWASTANQGSFANRIMGVALQETRCVFIGLSMTDVNIMRWLGIRFMEFRSDRRSYYELRNSKKATAEENSRNALNRHYWICTENDDPTQLIASHLERRGVTTVCLQSWGEPFLKVLEECFPPQHSAAVAP